MATKTYISPLGGIAIAKEDGKTLISPIRGIAIQQPAAAGGATLTPAAVSISISGADSPNINAAYEMTPPVAAVISIAGQAVTLLYDTIISVGAATISIAGEAVTITLGSTFKFLRNILRSIMSPIMRNILDDGSD